ncbi:MAG: YggS family pyridoxal phosphate-dependent enzyme [Nitrospirota bacterium]
MKDEQLLNNIKDVYRRISHAAMKAGRSPDEIRLIAVTKNIESNIIKKAVEIGLREFGENRIQEAQRKISDFRFQISDSDVKWHFVGHLQKNKAKYAVDLFDLIHSVDSVELSQEINKQAEKNGKIQKILLQVKLSDEAAKHGIIKGKYIDLIRAVSSMKNLSIEGLMTIPPFFDSPEMTRPFFRELRKIRDESEGLGFRLPELSMGMTGDFEVAIEEGATMVRIGTAIFGERRK